MADERKQLTPIDSLKQVLSTPSVREQFDNALKDNSALFTASLIDLYNGDKYLQECKPGQVVIEALKAATLKLPINKALGFAYIVPFKNKGVPTPTFILGYKGYIQLAMRTGFYKFLNADVVYEGEYKGKNKLTGEIDLSGAATSEKVVGYFAHMQMLNGFTKTVFWEHGKIIAHAKKYSKSYGNSSSAWSTNFDEMALKTVVRNLLSKYGYLSVEMMNAISEDISADERNEREVSSEIKMNANEQTIDIESETVVDEPETEHSKAVPDF
ncbi:recombinase RecT [Sporomusa paucivorans]|uniref:recombinase RecT n=1 Tax=Sporomusa paucivorans TaxID=2376 RepID=UPI003570C9D7